MKALLVVTHAKFFLILLICFATTVQAQNWSGVTPGNVYYNSGNVGINNSSPGALLDIKTGSNPQLYLSTSRTFSTSRNWGIGTNWNFEGDFSILESSSYSTAPSISRFVINVNGYVGINNTAPGALLDIKTGSSPQLYLSTSRTFSASRHWAIGTNWNSEGDFSILESTTNASAPALTRFLIHENGNVGIGTTNPDFKLTVNGKIKAEEIQVVVDVADYVFEEGYELKTLEEVKAFIQVNKHLPNVPGRQEVEANGYQVGQMTNRLLEKIEEMTLYMIALKEENEKLSQRLANMEKFISNLNNSKKNQ